MGDSHQIYFTPTCSFTPCSCVCVCSAALYARISVQCNQNKSKYQKTSRVARCPVTVFNEVLMFSLPDAPLLQCNILVSVFETDSTGKSSKRLMGQLSVSTAHEHWVLMVGSARQPVAKWHRLLI